MTQIETTAAEVFLHLIVTFLTPMFLTVTGDITHARIAAAETVKAYGARTHLDLLPIAQVIAFGLATLDSLNRSMDEALSTTVVLRLRANAASLSRAAEQCRRTLRASAAAQEPGTHAAQRWAAASTPEQTPVEKVAPQPRPEPLPATSTQSQAPTLVTQPVAAQPATTAPFTTQPITTQPTTRQTPTGPVATTQPITAQTANRTAWATAMTDVARECTAGLANLPPAESRQATMRAAALSSVAQHLLSNQPLPTSLVDTRFPIPPRRHP